MDWPDPVRTPGPLNVIIRQLVKLSYVTLMRSWTFGEYGGHVIVIAMQLYCALNSVCWLWLVVNFVENNNFKLFFCTRFVKNAAHRPALVQKISNWTSSNSSKNLSLIFCKSWLFYFFLWIFVLISSLLMYLYTNIDLYFWAIVVC